MYCHPDSILLVISSLLNTRSICNAMRNQPSWIVTHGIQNSVPLCIATLTQYSILAPCVILWEICHLGLSFIVSNHATNTCVVDVAWTHRSSLLWTWRPAGAVQYNYIQTLNRSDNTETNISSLSSVNQIYFIYFILSLLWIFFQYKVLVSQEVQMITYNLNRT